MFIYPALNYFLQMIRELFHTDVSDFAFERFQLSTPASKSNPDRLIPEQWETQVMVGEWSVLRFDGYSATSSRLKVASPFWPESSGDKVTAAESPI